MFLALLVCPIRNSAQHMACPLARHATGLLAHRALLQERSPSVAVGKHTCDQRAAERDRCGEGRRGRDLGHTHRACMSSWGKLQCLALRLA